MIKKFLIGLLVFLNITLAQQGTTPSSTTPQYQGGFTNQTQVGIDVIGAKGASGDIKSDSFLQVIRNMVNFILGLLALIALIVLLWGGFQMVTAAGDDKKYQQGFTILKQAGIGLIFIGVAFLIVQFIFFIIRTVAG